MKSTIEQVPKDWFVTNIEESSAARAPGPRCLAVIPIVVLYPSKVSIIHDLGNGLWRWGAIRKWNWKKVSEAELPEETDGLWKFVFPAVQYIFNQKTLCSHSLSSQGAETRYVLTALAMKKLDFYKAQKNTLLWAKSQFHFPIPFKWDPFESREFPLAMRIVANRGMDLMLMLHNAMIMFLVAENNSPVSHDSKRQMESNFRSALHFTQPTRCLWNTTWAGIHSFPRGRLFSLAGPSA